jgi:hypothetical protein
MNNLGLNYRLLLDQIISVDSLFLLKIEWCCTGLMEFDSSRVNQLGLLVLDLLESLSEVLVLRHVFSHPSCPSTEV